MKDKLLFEKIKNGNEAAFERLFRKYYTSLVKFAWGYVKSEAIAEEIVQDLFTNIWDKRNSLTIRSSVKSYLLSACRNMSIDHLKHRDVVRNWEKEKKALNKNITKKSKVSDDLHQRMILEEVENAIKSLPERRRLIFILSRYQDMTYKEIAELLDITVNTVDTQIRRALLTLREKFKNILLFLIGITELVA